MPDLGGKIVQQRASGKLEAEAREQTHFSSDNILYSIIEVRLTIFGRLSGAIQLRAPKDLTARKVD